MSPFAPVIALTIAFIVLLRVLIWQHRRDQRERAQRRPAALQKDGRDEKNRRR